MIHQSKTRKILHPWLGVFFAFSSLLTTLSSAEFSFSRHYSNGMVLQRDQPLVVKGLANKGSKVTVSLGDQTKTVETGDNETWVVSLESSPANHQGQMITATSDGDKITLNDVLIGDVILLARQTSVDITLGRDSKGQTAASTHQKNSLFRAISITTHPSAVPQKDLLQSATKGWSVVDKTTALAMTASSFYLGRDLSKELKVPVGIIDINLGSAYPLSWLSREALMETEKFFGDKEVMGQVSWHDKALEAELAGVPLKKKKTPPVDTVLRTLFPSGGYNAVLHPMQSLPLKAAAVQLGNDYPYMIYQNILDSDEPTNKNKLNTAYVECYNIRKVGFRMESKTTPRIARQWRKYLGNDDLPFGLIVPPGSDLNTLGQHHREMRELQRLVAEKVPGVSVILPGSENIPFSAQPSDEKLLAERTLSWILGSAYGHSKSTATGPQYEKFEANFNTATIFFKEGSAKGLNAISNDALNFFEVANVEGDYSVAKATIDGETIKLISDTITRIMRVRYNWNSRPNQHLVNESGIPVIPFRSEELPHNWFVTNKDDDLPEEYFTPANEWKKNDVTLINGKLKTHGYTNFTGWIGPAGFKTGPFGPNMGVREIKSGSPADGHLEVGDIIYHANGKMLGEKAWEVMGAAITDSETHQAGGKFVLGVRRGTKNMDVELSLEVMGTYSSTAPYDCPKTDKILRQLEEHVVAKGAGAGFLNSDAIFMLSTGNPELLGYVRRVVYNRISKLDPSRPIDTKREGKSWHNSADAFLLGEYYFATGDKNVLPHLKHAVDRCTETQNQDYGGWRQNFPGGAHYGFIPNAGLPGVMGMHFAKEAGLEIDEAGFALGVKHYSGGKAETGYLIYGSGECRREVPTPFDPEKLEAGKLDSFNGGISAAGILMDFVENPRAAHLCSVISAYAFNNTFGGHGGNFWNNFWTPLGAHQHSKKAFIHFWKNHRWYRECSRMYDGSLLGGGKPSAGYGVALVAPRRRIQIVGAPTSPFSISATPALKPALEAYWNRDYAECARQVQELIQGGSIGKDDMPTVEYLATTAKYLQDSINADLLRMEKLIKEGNSSEAKSFLLGLQGVLPEDDPRMTEIANSLKSVTTNTKRKSTKKSVSTEEQPRNWQRLVMESPSTDKKAKPPKDTKLLDQPSSWKLKVIEGITQAPTDWTQPNFNDESWMDTTLPISWRMYHTALLRTKFSVENLEDFDGLRLQAWVFRQQGIEIYLNGELIGKVNNIEKKTGNIENEFKESAMKHLRQGENTLALTTRHNWRWGMLFMKVYNDGFDFNFDASVKQTP